MVAAGHLHLAVEAAVVLLLHHHLPVVEHQLEEVAHPDLRLQGAHPHQEDGECRLQVVLHRVGVDVQGAASLAALVVLALPLLVEWGRHHRPLVEVPDLLAYQAVGLCQEAYRVVVPYLGLHQAVVPCPELHPAVVPYLGLRQAVVLFQAAAVEELFQLVAVEVPYQLAVAEALYLLAALAVEHDVAQILEDWPQVVERDFVLASVALAQMVGHDAVVELVRELVALHQAVVYAGGIDLAPVVLHREVVFFQVHQLVVVVSHQVVVAAAHSGEVSHQVVVAAAHSGAVSHQVVVAAAHSGEVSHQVVVAAAHSGEVSLLVVVAAAHSGEVSLLVVVAVALSGEASLLVAVAAARWEEVVAQ